MAYLVHLKEQDIIHNGQVHLEMLSVKVMERMTIMMILIHVHFILIGLQADLRIYQRKKV